MTVRLNQGTGMDPTSGLTLVLVPAAETEFTRSGRFQGDVDVPLTEEGRERSLELTESLVERFGALEAVYCGENQSARETAQILAGADGHRVRILPGLRGVSFGLWEGQLVEEVRRRHGRIFERWRRSPLTIAPPQGEEMDEAFVRAGRAVRAIGKKHQDGAVAVVAPDTMIALVYCQLTERSPESVFEVQGRIDGVEVVSAGGGR